METTQSTMTPSSNESLEQTIRELRDFEKRNLRINRIKLICAAAAVVVCMIIALVLVINVGKITREVESASKVMTEAGESINEVAKNLNEIDFEALGTSVQTFTDIGTDTVEQIKTSTQGLDTLLIEAHTALENLSSVNIEELNSGIEKLNAVLEPLARFFK